jgi:Fe-S-cluster-containing hydrogenase component 2
VDKTMPVIINFKMCSNGWQCDCPAKCPTGAFYYDKVEKTLKIANAKCISCGACAKACPLGAVFVAKTAAEFAEIEKQIMDDPRRKEDLRVEKLGADPIAAPVSDINDFISKNEYAVVELKQDEAVWACQLNSINISDIVDLSKWKYASVVGAKKLYEVSELPALVFFHNGEKIGSAEGYFDNSLNEYNFFMKKVWKIIGE